ncbi:MAG: hypothetical protein J2P21_21870 [Chloracidobacterium sp.]|nr:hypothetical protein [Chloracidobacterium sp.]
MGDVIIPDFRDLGTELRREKEALNPDLKAMANAVRAVIASYTTRWAEICDLGAIISDWNLDYRIAKAFGGEEC